MRVEVFQWRSRIEAPAAEVFRWHTRPGAFDRCNPPWNPMQVIERTGGVEDGSRAVLRMKAGPFRRRFFVEHFDYKDGVSFRDRQVRGPFAHWQHLHNIVPDGSDTSLLEDTIEYALPLGGLGRTLLGDYAFRHLYRTFAYRHRVVGLDIAAHHRYADRQPLRVLITGSHGLVGSALIPFLTSGGHEVTRLVRRTGPPGESTIPWDPALPLDAKQLEGFDAVVHLAGESIAAGRWTARKKARIRDSRVAGTRNLCEALAKLDAPPRVLVCASAIGYYGSRGDEVLREESGVGTGFLAEVCQDWEAATEPARTKGIRVVNSRFGVILDPRGGALAKMLLPFRMNAAGVIGNGRQYMSWIALDDAIGAIHHAIQTETAVGPINATTPHPVTNRQFTKTLGDVLDKWTIFPMPAFAAQIALGEMADELLLSSQYVEPGQLLRSRYPFRHPYLMDALRHMLGRA